MAKSNRAEAAAKAAAMRAEATRKDRQRKQLISAVVAVIVVIIAVAVGVVISNRPNTPATNGNSAAAAEIAKLGSLPASAFGAAGVPTESNAIPQKIPDGTVLMDGTKPKVSYVGAEFCPYCATERWSLVAALERFGNFTGLTETRSAQNEGDIPTVSFVGSTYKSDDISFQAVETQDRDHKPLEQMPTDLEKLFGKYNAPPYVPEKSAGAIPWMFYGTHQTVGSGVPVQSFTNLAQDTAWTTIVDQMRTGKGEYGQPIMANANAITAQICQLTKGKPTDVCTSPAVVKTTPLLKQ